MGRRFNGMLPDISDKGGRPDAFSHSHRLQTDNICPGPNRPFQQIGLYKPPPKSRADQKKLKSTMGTLPQLETPAKRVVLGNAKPQHHMDATLPHVTNKEEIPRGPHFPTNFSPLLEKLSVPSSPKNLVNKLEKEQEKEQEKERFFEGLRLPLLPTEALKHSQDRLTKYEQEEILDYSEIWYLGLDTKKIEASHGTPQNSGYDDEHGSYIKVLHDHIAYRYEVLEVLGKGSFGQVLKCVDHKNNEMVAIKVIRNKKRFHNQALVELKILDAVRRRDKDNSYNVIHMKEYFYFRNHLCISFELLGMNLYELIKKNNFRGFSMTQVRRYAFSLLRCLQMIQSRFYRSPEVILGHSYSMAIDMWSLGCILAELYTGYPLFPGESEWEQMACIMEIFGMPPKDFVQTASRRKLFFDARGYPSMSERLRPIGASTEEKTSEDVSGLQQEAISKAGLGGERAIHIIIKPQELVEHRH